MNTDKIQDIIRVFEESGLHKMELEVDDMKIKMEKGQLRTAGLCIWNR